MGAGSAQIMLTDLRPPSLFVIWSMVYALLLIATTCNSALVKKIAVIGSGTGGLALAATLNRIGSGVKEITLFEERSSALQANAGGGVQLSGGAAILEKLGCSLSGSGVSLTRISSRNHLGDSIMNIDLAKAVRSHAPSLLSQDDSQAPMLYTVMREVLQQTLFDAATTRPLLAASPTVKVIENKRCNHITEMREGLKPSVTLHFADGDQSAGFDILVGADGVNSAVRQYVEGVSIKSDSSRVVRTGLRIAFCITPSVGRSHSRDGKGGEEGVLRQWFGDGVYALLGTYGGFTGVHRMLAVVYHADQSNPSTITAGTTGWDATNSDVPRTRQVQEMQRRLEAGKLGANAAILEVLQAASGEGGRFFDVAVKERLLPLRRWSSKSGRVVLLGDAAHPM
jgi:2-polyprenyl-6-methoxyphenol hydroxylase-like FAD-dependent oxidoreductase